MDERFAKAAPPPKNPAPPEATAYPLQTPDGKLMRAPDALR
jgi:hypothetical protein